MHKDCFRVFGKVVPIAYGNNLDKNSLRLYFFPGICQDCRTSIQPSDSLQLEKLDETDCVETSLKKDLIL